MNRYQASVLNRLTDKGGPGWTIAALVVMRGIPVIAIAATGRAIGWW